MTEKSGDRNGRRANRPSQDEKHAFIQRQVLLLVVYVLVIYGVATRADGAIAMIVVATGVLAGVAGAFAGLRRRRTRNRTG